MLVALNCGLLPFCVVESSLSGKTHPSTPAMYKFRPSFGTMPKVHYHTAGEQVRHDQTAWLSWCICITAVVFEDKDSDLSPLCYLLLRLSCQMTRRLQPSWKRVSVVMTTDLSQTWTCQSTLTLPSTAPSSPPLFSLTRSLSTLAHWAWSKVTAVWRRVSSWHCNPRQSPPPHTRVSSLPTHSPTVMEACPMTVCSTPASPQPLPVSAWPTVVCPPWGSTRPTCPPKRATSENLKCRGRLPAPTVQWCHPGGWEGSLLIYETGTHPQCATTTSPRLSWPPSRSERRWKRGRSVRCCMGVLRPISTPRTLECLKAQGVMACPPTLATQMGLAAPAPEAQHLQPMGVPGTTWWVSG